MSNLRICCRSAEVKFYIFCVYLLGFGNNFLPVLLFFLLMGWFFFPISFESFDVITLDLFNLGGRYVRLLLFSVRIFFYNMLNCTPTFFFALLIASSLYYDMIDDLSVRRPDPLIKDELINYMLLFSLNCSNFRDKSISKD